MTQQTISTWQRVERLMDAMLTVEHSEPYPHEDGTMGGEYSDYVYDEDHKFRNLIAAEIDALTRERDEARAEVAKLKEQNRVLATTSLRDVIKSVHPSGRSRGQ